MKTFVNFIIAYFYREMNEPLTAEEELEAIQIQTEFEQVVLQIKKLYEEFEKHVES